MNDVDENEGEVLSFALRPCPFCGGPAKFFQKDAQQEIVEDGEYWDLGCETDGCYAEDGCNWNMKIMPNILKAMSGMWNKRQTPEEYKVYLEDLKNYQY